MKAWTVHDLPQRGGAEWLYNAAEARWELRVVSALGRLRHGPIRAVLRDVRAMASHPFLPALCVEWVTR